MITLPLWVPVAVAIGVPWLVCIADARRKRGQRPAKPKGGAG